MNKEMFIIDNALDEIEFRNKVAEILSKNGYADVKIDDPGLNDGFDADDNDLTAKKGNKKYTVQTFLNTNISEKEIEETIADMQDEKVNKAIIITNYYCTKKFVEIAAENNIEIIDREKLEKMLEE